ncbi:MAG: arsenate reductase family protein [Eubacteriales bacterium]
MLFICYPKCTTCQKARRWLDEHGVDYTVRDIKTDNPSLEELRSWYSKAGQPIKRFFNTSGLLYKSLGLKDKLGSMSEDETLELLSTDGMLVKRPIIVEGSTILIGFDETQWKQALV